MSIQQSDSFTARVRDLSQTGAGVIDHPDGLVCFCEGVWPGDLGVFEVVSRERRYGVARLVSLIEGSPDRISKVPCPYQGADVGSCGGCPWMPFDIRAQENRKVLILKHALDRGGLSPWVSALRPMASSPNSLGYRSRAQVKTDGVRLGFVSRGSKVLMDVHDCLILTPPLRDKLRALRGTLPRSEWKPSPPYLWNFMDLHEDVDAADIKINRRGPFAQANREQNAFMQRWIYDQACQHQAEHLGGGSIPRQAIELFAGDGNFTFELVKAGFESIACWDVAQPGIRRLREQGWVGVEGWALDLLKDRRAHERVAEASPKATFLLLDPPRDGYHNLTRLLSLLPYLRTVVYVSCSVSTFVRDSVGLRDQGYFPAAIQPVDQFPHTPHLELLAVFHRADAHGHATWSSRGEGRGPSGT